MIKYTWVEKADPATGEHTVALKFLEGKYAGMIFSYGDMETIDHGDEDKLTQRFNYKIHRYPPGIELDNLDMDEVEYVLGGFLHYLIDNNKVGTETRTMGEKDDQS